MLHHYATRTPSGPCVAYTSIWGGEMVVCECLTPQAARSEAARLNAEGLRREELTRLREFAQRRPMRFFSDDSYA